jgi:DNA polymerase IV
MEGLSRVVSMARSLCEEKPDPVTDLPRAIVHLDLDAFFAAVEVLLDASLAGKPVIVGGSPEGRGVVASASYAARAFGIRSAMPTYRALQLCPAAIVLPPRHRLYRDYSQQVMAILHQACPLVEQMSIDEAYLDLSDRIVDWEDCIGLAREIQDRVRDEVHLSASLGVATNKLVAKVASDRDKPGGLTVVRPGQEAGFLAPLPVRVLWGVGPVTAQKLAGLGVQTVGDLALVDEAELQARFGQYGLDLARRARGIDTRPVSSEHETKSVSQERTFHRDVRDPQVLAQQLQHLSQGVAHRLERHGLAAATIGLKIRYADFTTLSRQMTLDVPTDDEQVIYQAASTLFRRTWKPGRAIRLLGVAGRNLSPPPGQLSLW